MAAVNDSDCMKEHPALLSRSTQPVLLPDQPWEEGGRISPVATFIDESSGDLLLYYLLRSSERALANALCLARSNDGVNWTKPDYDSGTNIVMRSCGNENDWGQFYPCSIIRDEHETDETQNWKMIYWDCPDPKLGSGICLATSPDGIQWNRLHNHPIITGANDAASLIDAFPDAKTPFKGGSHFIHQQTFTYNPDLPTDRDNLKQMHRAISIWKCDKFDERWVGPVRILEPDVDDEPDLQFYWLTAFKTPSGVYGGFLNCHHTLDQTMDVQLVSSKDGWSWTRENDRDPVIPLAHRGQFDCGLVSAIVPPVIWKDSVWVFYQGRPTVHDAQPRYPEVESQPNPGIGLAQFSTDFFNLNPQ